MVRSSTAVILALICIVQFQYGTVFLLCRVQFDLISVFANFAEIVCNSEFSINLNESRLNLMFSFNLFSSIYFTFTHIQFVEISFVSVKHSDLQFTHLLRARTTNRISHTKILCIWMCLLEPKQFFYTLILCNYERKTVRYANVLVRLYIQWPCLIWSWMWQCLCVREYECECVHTKLFD